MKKTFAGLLLCFCLAGSPFSFAQTWQWAKCSKQCSNPSHSIIEADQTAIDPHGNIFVAGENFGTCTIFGADTITNTAPGAANSMFLVKYDSSGNYKWSRSTGLGSDGRSFGVATDDSGNVYWSGNFSAPSVTFGTHTLTTSGGAGFLVKYDSSGNVLWAKKCDGWAGNTSVTTSPDGSIYLIGSFLSGTLTADAFSLTNSGTGNDMFLLKYDAAGNVQWARSAGAGSYNDDGIAASCDGSGNVYVLGYFESPSIAFGSATLANSDPTKANIYVAKYTSAGTALWAKEAVPVGGTSTALTGNIKADNTGNVYITGMFNSDTLQMGAYYLRNDTVPNTDLYLGKLDPSGNILWLQRGGGKGDDAGYSMTIDGLGNLWLAGGSTFTDSLLLDTAHIYVPLTDDASFVAEFSPTGHILYHTVLNMAGDDYLGIVTDRNGNIYIGGDYIYGPYYLGGDTLGNYGIENFMVAKLGRIVNLAPLDAPVKTVEREVSLYPNPATEKFVITTEEPSGNAYVSVVNTLGREIKRVPVVSSMTSIATADMAPGIYLCRIVLNGAVTVRRVVVERM